ncbi:unnamed protein product [Caretta caretta]
MDLSSLDIVLSRHEQSSAFCLPLNWLLDTINQWREVQAESTEEWWQSTPCREDAECQGGIVEQQLKETLAEVDLSSLDILAEEEASLLRKVTISEACSRPVQQPQTEEEHLEEVDLHNLDISLGSGAEEVSCDVGGGVPNEIG